MKKIEIIIQDDDIPIWHKGEVSLRQLEFIKKLIEVMIENRKEIKSE